MTCKYCSSTRHLPDQCDNRNNMPFPTKSNQHHFPIHETVKWKVTYNCQDDVAQNIIKWLR